MAEITVSIDRSEIDNILDGKSRIILSILKEKGMKVDEEGYILGKLDDWYDPSDDKYYYRQRYEPCNLEEQDGL